jgi:hypothetical protein
MALMSLSDDACERLVASRDPIDARRLRDETVVDSSRRLHDALVADLAARRPSPSVTARPPRRRRLDSPRRRVAAIAAIAVFAAAAAFSVISLLPSGGDETGMLGAPTASAAVVLDRASQAAERLALVAPKRGQYGFLKVESGSVVGGGGKGWGLWTRLSVVKSDWYSASGSGRERTVQTLAGFLTRRDRAIAHAHGMTLAQLAAAFPHVTDGALGAGSVRPGVFPYWQIATAGRLPTQPAALRRAVERMVAAVPTNRRGSSVVDEFQAQPADLFSPISQFLSVPISPQLRAALFRVLADLPGVELLGDKRDHLGRRGVAVAVDQGTGTNRVREELLFDPATSNVLQTDVVQLQTTKPSRGVRTPPLPGGTVIQYTDFVSRGVVGSVTQLPGGGRLPLKPGDSGR